MVITYEIEKTVTTRTVSLRTLTETTHTDVIQYVDVDRKTVFKEFTDMADIFENWEVDEYDTDSNVPSFVAHKETDTQSTRVEIIMRNGKSMYYEDY